MLRFLVSSPARRKLLELLWLEKASGSITELAVQAGICFASAHRELSKMRQFDLVISGYEGRKEVFSANKAHPDASLLKKLVGRRSKPISPRGDAARRVRGKLRALGAPLQVNPVPTTEGVEEILAKGVRLARRDPAVARSLPICFWKLRDELDPEALQALSKRLGEKRTLGFLLEMTGRLSGDRRFHEWARPLHDGRFRAKHDFFHSNLSPHFLQEKRTPEVARRWGFRMNLTEESFKSLFKEFTGAAS